MHSHLKKHRGSKRLMSYTCIFAKQCNYLHRCVPRSKRTGGTRAQRIASAHCTASQTGWIALDQIVLHVKPSSAGDWSLIGGTGPRAPVAVRTLDYWGQGSEQVRSAALKLQRYAVPIGFLHKLHYTASPAYGEPYVADVDFGTSTSNSRLAFNTTGL